MSKKSTIKVPKEQPVIFSFGRGLNSITAKQLDETCEYCSRLIEKKYNGDYESRTLRSMLGTIIGRFDLLKSKLINDYNKTRNTLKRRQNRKIKKVSKMIKDFEKTVIEHEMALKRYSDNIAEYNGYPIEEDLHYSRADLQMLKARLNKIEEKNHEA